MTTRPHVPSPRLASPPPRRLAIQCILPPHIVSNLARNGSAEQRSQALDLLASWPATPAAT